MSGFEPVRFERLDPKVMSTVPGEVRHGTRGGRHDVRLLGGWFAFDSPDSTLLVSLLPSLVHVRGVERLSLLVRLAGEEASERRSGRDLVLTRLVEVLLIEALRLTPGEDAPPGLLRGLADAQLVSAMRQMHGQLPRSWTVAQFAKTAALSRSTFFERFTRTVGLPPGIPARLAHGRREGSAPPSRHRARRGRRARRLQLGEHLQHGVQTTRGPASESLRTRSSAPGRLTKQRRGSTRRSATQHCAIVHQLLHLEIP